MILMSDGKNKTLVLAGKFKKEDAFS